MKQAATDGFVEKARGLLIEVLREKRGCQKCGEVLLALPAGSASCSKAELLEGFYQRTIKRKRYKAASAAI
jgi:hypothetical protein